ncbi:MAG: hypothetical protein LBT59_30845 [Clostridiales bacterium]|nr:hypothetical protein [Clostridiales bacterium]
MFTIANDSIEYLGQCRDPSFVSSDSSFPGIFANIESMGVIFGTYDSIKDGAIDIEDVNIWYVSYPFGERVETVSFISSNSALVEASRRTEPLKRYIGREAIMEELGVPLILNEP